jgi:hypothetical protein
MYPFGGLELPNTRLNAKKLARLCAGGRCPRVQASPQGGRRVGVGRGLVPDAAVGQLPRCGVSPRNINGHHWWFHVKHRSLVPTYISKRSADETRRHRSHIVAIQSCRCCPHDRCISDCLTNPEMRRIDKDDSKSSQ